MQAKQCFSVLHYSVILDAIQYFSEAMQDHFGAESFEHQVSFVSKIAFVLQLNPAIWNSQKRKIVRNSGSSKQPIVND